MKKLLTILLTLIFFQAQVFSVPVPSIVVPVLLQNNNSVSIPQCIHGSSVGFAVNYTFYIVDYPLLLSQSSKIAEF